MVSISSALREVTPSVSVSLSMRGANPDSSLAFGAATLRTFCTCVTRGPSRPSNLPAFKGIQGCFSELILTKLFFLVNILKYRSFSHIKM